MKTRSIGILIVVFILSILSVQAQVNQTASDTTTVWQIITVDDNEFIGTITEETPAAIKLQTETYGLIEISRANISRMIRIDTNKMVNEEYMPDHLQSTRYFWAPSGYSLGKGEAYYQNVWIFFNQFSAGISKNFSIGIGTIPIMLMGGDANPLWITPKFSIPLVENKLNLAAGALIGDVIGESDSFFGLAYGNLTFGKKDKNISLGLGYGFTGDGWGETPVFSFSAIRRVSKKGYFLTENYFINDGDEFVVTLLIGGRTVWRKISLDYGALIPIVEDMDGFIAVPWLGLIIPFTPKNNQKY